MAMTREKAIRIAALAQSQLNLIDWWDETLAKESAPAVVFGEISVRGDLGSHGWEGEVVLPLDVVAVMFQAAKEHVAKELAELGVEPLPIGKGLGT